MKSQTQPTVLIRAARENDTERVRAFLDSERNALARIEYFYPYTEQELDAVVKGGDFYIACKEDGTIVGSFGLDPDRSYASDIAGRVRDCSSILQPQMCYEVSGLMVSPAQRGTGLAGKLMRQVLERAQVRFPQDWISGVVQLENIASMRTFWKNGFVLGGIYAMGGAYDFGYFVRPTREKIATGAERTRVAMRDMNAHRDALRSGLVGIADSDGQIVYADPIV